MPSLGSGERGGASRSSAGFHCTLLLPPSVNIFSSGLSLLRKLCCGVIPGKKRERGKTSLRMGFTKRVGRGGAGVSGNICLQIWVVARRWGREVIYQRGSFNLREIESWSISIPLLEKLEIKSYTRGGFNLAIGKRKKKTKPKKLAPKSLTTPLRYRVFVKLTWHRFLDYRC